MTRWLVAAQGPFAAFRLTREMGKLGAEALAVLRERRPVPWWLEPPLGHEVGTPTKDNPDGSGFWEVAEVDLADGIQPFVARAFEASFDPEWDDEEQSRCQAWIDTRRLPPSGAPLTVILGQEPIGTLDGQDALTLERELREAEKREQPLILEATIEREDGRLGVWVDVP